MKKAWTLVVLAASLAYGRETSPTIAIETDHFTAKVPAGWQVKLVSQSTNRWAYAFLDGTNDVFKADVWTGTGFIDCFCAPWSEYNIIKREHEEARTIRMGHLRTLKIAGECYSLDIHAYPEVYDDRLIDRVLMSISMKWKSERKSEKGNSPDATTHR